MTNPPPTDQAFKTRPLSPHLQVWRWTLTMFASILHRTTGCALASGTIILTWWIVAVAQGPEAYATFSKFSTSMIGQLMLFGWLWAICLHLFSGIRHLIMDTGRLLSIQGSDRVIVFNLLVGTALACAIWAFAKHLI